MKCKGHMDVPYTCGHTRRVYWKEEPCGCEAKPGRKFCMWHDRPDFLPAIFVNEDGTLKNKPNKDLRVGG